MKKIILLSFLMILSCFNNVGHAEIISDHWDSYIYGTLGNTANYLYRDARDKYFPLTKTYRSFDFGSGAGNEIVDMVKRGWDVTGIDIDPISGVVINQRVKGFKGKFNFQQGDFSAANMQGNYDLVTSLFSLPFGNKKDLPALLTTISEHMDKGSVFAVVFFGYDSDYVKKAYAYGISQDELANLLALNHFVPHYFMHREYDEHDYAGVATHWDVFEVIALKS